MAVVSKIILFFKYQRILQYLILYTYKYILKVLRNMLILHQKFSFLGRISLFYFFLVIEPFNIIY